MRTILLLVTLALGFLVVSLTADAQPPTHVHRIGWLSGGGRGLFVEEFLEGMRALGYVEGQHLVLEVRGAEGQYERLPALAAELVRLQVDVLLVVGSTPAALAAKDATTTIPIVMADVGDPVGSGLVASLARPGGNVTGLAAVSPELVGKQLEFLKDVLGSSVNSRGEITREACDVLLRTIRHLTIFNGSHIVFARFRGKEAIWWPTRCY